MDRPIYETEEDLKREKIVRNEIEKTWGVVTEKLPYKELVDVMLLVDGVCVGWAEIKNRDNHHDKYPTLMISLNKCEAGFIRSRLTGKPFYIVVKWSDGFTLYHKLEDLKSFDIGIGGRWDRNDKGDVESVVHIPISYFSFLEQNDEMQVL